MKKILVINLKRNGDIFQSQHLINSLNLKHPYCAISYLCYKEFESAAKVLDKIEDVHAIDRLDLTFKAKSKLFNQFKAFDIFLGQVHDLKLQEFDLVINYSNDPVSSYLTSYLTYKNFAGIKISDSGTVDYSNESARLFNDVLTDKEHSPIHFISAYHDILDISISSATEQNDRPISNSHINDYFLKLRSEHSSDRKLVGIQISASTREKSLSPEEISIIYLELEKNNYLPILLSSPGQQDSSILEVIKKYVGEDARCNKFLFSEAFDVLQSIDLLVTPDTSIKHLADITGTPCKEIVKKSTTFLRQGTLQEHGEVLYFENGQLNKNQLEDLCSYLADSDVNLESLNSFSIFKGQKRGNSFSYSVKGPRPAWYDNYIFNHELAIKINNPEYSATLLNTIEQDSKNCIRQSVRKITGDGLKLVLSGLRNLKVSQEQSKAQKNFIQDLNGLLGLCKESQDYNIPFLLFRSRVDNLKSTDPQKITSEIETAFYKLKDDLNIQLFLANELHSKPAPIRVTDSLTR